MKGAPLARAKQEIYCELLVLRCRRRQEGAFEELVRLWEQRLFYYVRRLVQAEEDAWDVLQQTWLSAFKGIGSLRDPGRLPVWLYRIARNRAISHLRARYARQLPIDEESGVAEIEGNDNAGAFDDAEQVHHGLSRLAPGQREVLTLFFLEDLTTAEIAEVLAVPLGTVKSRLHHAKRALRDVLER